MLKSIKAKLIMLITIPTLIIMLFIGDELNINLNKLNNIEQLEKTMLLVEKISNFVHETQKERGLTAGFLGSKGRKFSIQLPKQRLLTDKRYDSLKKYFNSVNFNSFNPKLFEKMSNLLDYSNNINHIRSKVDIFSIKKSDAISFYTKGNSKYLSFITKKVKLSKDNHLTQKMLAHSNFIWSKEKAGIERAIGTGILAVDKTSTKLKVKYSRFVISQEAYLKNSERFMSKKVMNFYKKTVKGKDIEEVIRIRKKLLELNKNFNEKPNYWFNQITSKINKLKIVEDYLFKDVITKIYNDYHIIKNHMIKLIIISVLILLLVIFLSFFILKNIFAKLFNLDIAIKNLLETKDVSSRIDVSSFDEIGIISDNFNKYLDSIEEGIKQDKLFIEDANIVFARVGNGWFSQPISVNSNNPALLELKSTVNSALLKLKNSFIDIDLTLKQYSNQDYRKALKIDGIEKNGVFDKLLIEVENLRQSIVSMLIENKSNGLALDISSDSLLKNVDVLNNNSNTSATAIEETAAAIEEITSNISHNTDNVVQMVSYANNVTKSVNTGHELANKTKTSMDDINSEVSSISEAIQIINQISFQTNILSLNAAVEAATAGEAGKGFAVVAQEVRKLAESSKNSADEIQKIVDRAKEKALDGKNISDMMIEGYSELDKDIAKTVSLIHDVETASKEQLKGIEQINDAINSLDRQTQQNASIATQTYEVAQQTDKVAKIVVSKVDENEFIGKNEVKPKQIGKKKGEGKRESLNFLFFCCLFF